ncbi:hypothetical protein F0U61_50745 [Archangium violaceum]|uniref:hypothetical protein n=1 Tax=Archangium violaceum TaxID=83451 RepID=UPI002B324CE0|nr:hypothetical protein F0U61_50745 [Archangium violaceum]
MSVAEWVVSLGGSGAAAALFSWIFQQSYGKALDRAMERYKNDLQRQTQQQLEQVKSELNARNDMIRHELQKQMLRAQLSTTKTHEVYSQLIKLVRQAEGAIGALWGMRRAPTFEKFSAADIQQVLQEAKAPGEEEREILEHFATDRKGAISRLNEVLRRKEMNDALGSLTALKNHIILEGIFMTRRVRELSFKVANELHGAFVAVEVGTLDRTSSRYYEDNQRHIEQAAKDIESLEELMRADLFPGLVDSLPAAPATPESR